MFAPNYRITNEFLAVANRIARVITSLNGRRFPSPVLLTLEREARELSSFASTSIEGNPLPLTDVKELLKQHPLRIRDTQREVLNYNTALLKIKEEIDAGRKGIALSDVLSIHRLTTDGLLSPDRSGVLRHEPVFVNDPRARQTVFWPPDHADVPLLLADLFDFIRTNELVVDPLILAGLFHKQFVLIHPFMDGNGRTVRLATKKLLAALGLDTFHLFSFEQYYNRNVTNYFSLVGGRGNYYDLTVDFTPWLQYFAEGILDELLRVEKELEKRGAAPATGFKEHERLLLAYLQEHGSITDAVYATLVPRARATRALDFRRLLALHAIYRHGKGRATYYTLTSPS